VEAAAELAQLVAHPLELARQLAGLRPEGPHVLRDRPQARLGRLAQLGLEATPLEVGGLDEAAPGSAHLVDLRPHA
jgi:hypothetical protein